MGSFISVLLVVAVVYFLVRLRNQYIRNASSSSFFDSKINHDQFVGNSSRNIDFNLMILAASVMKADGRVLRAELDYVKRFLLKNYGERKALYLVRSLKEILKQEYDLRMISRTVGNQIDYTSRKNIINFLFGIATIDKICSASENRVLEFISTHMFLNSHDFHSIKNNHGGSSDSAYAKLEINPNSTDQEIKKAYHKMAIKYHPDKLMHLSDNEKAEAEKKFSEINSAYDLIKKERGLN
ncbi:MAG: DnaJ domain-containing protein [Hyphomicrobiales bacterium]